MRLGAIILLKRIKTRDIVRKESDSMFNNARYMTKGIQTKIPLELQLFMWNCIANLKQKEQEMDYLQVFELTKERANNIPYQKIEHRQEVPEYSESYRMFPLEIINAKIFVIDDGDHTTMMLAEEY